MLSYYSSVLGTVEINYTFRRRPSESTLQAWKEQTPEGFRFTLKAPQRITHFKRLKDVQEEVDEFIRLARLLDQRLGTILFQLPPNMKYDRARLEGFLSSLPPVVKYAMEFRHDSFRDEEVRSLLAQSEVAYCGADTDEAALLEIPAGAGHAYLRLRKEHYAPKELKGWGEKIAQVVKSGRDVYCYLKHEDGGLGPKYALQIKQAAAHQ